MRELRPGVFTALFGKVIAAERAAGKIALTQIAQAIEKQAKINASNGAHKRGTPTPARPGEGPAVISGTLRRSITHEPIKPTLTGWETKVGTGVGLFPPYGKNRTPASKYGKYLETGLRNGAKYPFLKPAVNFIRGGPALLIFKSAYSKAIKF